LTPAHREYAALKGFQYSPLRSMVLSGKPSELVKAAEEVVNSISKKYDVNGSQAEAIYGALQNKGFTLILG
jgi:senataxin